MIKATVKTKKDRVTVKGSVRGYHTSIMYEALELIGCIKRRFGEKLENAGVTAEAGEEIFVQLLRNALDDPESPINKKC